MQSILKNIIITVLLIIVVCLILALIFYSELPFNKEVPPDVDAYATSEPVKTALTREIKDKEVTDNVVALDKDYITMMESGDLYRSGKANPFGNMSVQNFVTMPDEYVASGGLHTDNTIFDVDWEKPYEDAEGTSASSSSSSSGRVVENKSTSSATKSNSSTDSFYKSSGLK